LFKKLIFSAVLFLPSFAFADRLGGLGRESDVALSTGAIQNTSTLQSGATFYVSSGTVQNNFQFTDSDSAQKLRVFHTDLPRSFGIGPQIVNSYLALDSFEASSTAGGLTIVASTDPVTQTEIGLVRGFSSVGIIPPYGAQTGSVSLATKLHGFGGLESRFTMQASTINFAVGGVNVAVWDTNGFTSTYNLIAEEVVSSVDGTFAFQGSTITFDAPPIDSLDRLPVLNSGVVTWDTAVTDGVVESGTHTITGQLTLSKQLIYSASTVTARELFPMSWPIVGSSDTYTVAGSSIPLWGKTHGAITISTITAAVIAASQDINGDLKFTATDNCLNYNSSTLIDAIDTTGSIMTSGGIDDATIPAGSCIFLVLDGNLNNNAILQISAEASIDP
jgi:hypothetical protein